MSHYDVCIKQCSVRLYSQLFVGGLMSYLRYLYLFAYSFIKHVLTIWVTSRVSYKRQELLILREHHSSHPVFDGINVAHLFNFLCCVLFCVAFVLVLCIVCPMLPVSLDWPFLIALSVFSNVYFIYALQILRHIMN